MGYKISLKISKFFGIKIVNFRGRKVVKTKFFRKIHRKMLFVM